VTYEIQKAVPDVHIPDIEGVDDAGLKLAWETYATIVDADGKESKVEGLVYVTPIMDEETQTVTEYTVEFEPTDSKNYKSVTIENIKANQNGTTGGNTGTTPTVPDNSNTGNDSYEPGSDEPKDPGKDNPNTDGNEPDDDNPDDPDRIDIPKKNINRVNSDKDGQDNGRAKNKKKDKEKSSGRSRTPVVTEDVTAPIEKVQEIVNDVVAKVFNYETGGVIFGAVQVGAAVATGMISIKWIRAFLIVIIDTVVFISTLLVVIISKRKEDKKK
jgi:hypothetical protein